MIPQSSSRKSREKSIQKAPLRKYRKMTPPEAIDTVIRRVLEGARTIAVVGVSQNPDRPSNYVMKFLQDQGYRTIPINPGLAGQTLWGETVYASLAEAPGPFEMVDIFRASDAAGAVVDEAIGLKAAKGVGSVWLQIGVIDEAAAARARAAGLDVVMNRCPKVEFPRLIGRRIS